jgi:phosphatidylglycerophosphatase A
LQAIALLLFRFFDITKPGPIRKAERAKPVGLGIMLDDVVAGVVAGAIAFALSWVPGLG